MMATLKFVRPMSDLSHEFQELAAQINELYEARPTPDSAAPGELLEGISQLFSITSNIEKNQAARTELKAEEITQVGEFGFNLLSELLHWSGLQRLKKIEYQTRTIITSLAYWVVQLNGSIQSLDIVVESIAKFANQTKEPEELCEVAKLMEKVSLHCDPQIYSNLQPGQITDAWRALLLNSAIIATRSHNEKLMRDCFNRLINALPEDASVFFTQGMQQMDKFDYPDSVRSIMQEYFNRYTRPKMN